MADHHQQPINNHSRAGVVVDQHLLLQQQQQPQPQQQHVAPPERLLEQELLQLKKQHQLQHQILLQSFQQQQQHLSEQHEQQLRQHLKEFWEQQKHLQEIREREQIEAIRKKEKHEESAIASTEVKQKLQAFLRQRTSGLSVGAHKGINHTNQENSWSEGMDTSSDQSSTNDFPLRKTASEPNLLKVRLKQRVMERRSSPMSKRHLPPSSLTKKKQLLLNNLPPPQPNTNHQAATMTTGNNNIDSPKELSPATCADAAAVEDYQRHHALFSSPSMPNISLAAHHVLAAPDLSEAAVRAACTARLGMPLTGQMLTGPLPFYPSLPAIDSSEHEEAASLDTISELQEPASSSATTGGGTQHYNNTSRHQQMQMRGVIRPLGRTQSSPLPLGHPLLDGNVQAQVAQAQALAAQAMVGIDGHVEHVGGLVPVHHMMLPMNMAIGLTVAEQEQIREREHHGMEPLAHQVGLTEPRSIRPLSRALSSPIVHLGHPPPTTAAPSSTLSTVVSVAAATPSSVAAAAAAAAAARLAARRIQQQTTGATSNGPAPTTGLAYDSQMLKHACICGNNGLHPEHAGRLQSIWARLMETGLAHRCDRLRPRKASTHELQTCHTEAHALLYGTSSLNRHKMDLSKLTDMPMATFVRLVCGGIGVDSDTTWNDIYTAPAARMAVGCTVDLACRTWTGDIRNGFAIVRPPGHHAEPQQAMGFCFFNSIAIAARLLQREHRVHKILIFDWDVHHGNGTQEIFYDDPRVLVISMHRHDDGNFFPGTGNPDECGTGSGLGFNVNIAWSGGLEPPLGDAEYLAAFRSVVMPIAREFAPDIVLVSAGFDAADGHAPPLGGYRLTPACFGYMTRHLMSLSNGKVVLALEGGYDLASICDSAEECVRVLLGDAPTPIAAVELTRAPCANAVLALQKVLALQSPHWPCLQSAAKTISCSYNDVLRSENEDKDTVNAMASLSMQQQNNSQQQHKQLNIVSLTHSVSSITAPPNGGGSVVRTTYPVSPESQLNS